MKKLTPFFQDTRKGISASCWNHIEGAVIPFTLVKIDMVVINLEVS